MLRSGEVHVHRAWKRFRADPPVRDLRGTVSNLRERRRDASARWRWALRDVSVDIDPGDALAVIGANGSGKSTLLKILTGVMDPYAGRSDVGGRLGALIEVRAGIHPELSGRENVFLAGSLLGMSRRSVAERFDEIVQFAELQDAIDRQVKFYSTGMQMRLGFAVAAFLEPDVLVVDEVLAVGDATFQQRCLDRMRTVLAAGTTLVFVSHDLAAVQAMCRRGVWLQEGVVAASGPVDGTLAAYRQWVDEMASAEHTLVGDVRLLKVEVTGVRPDAVVQSHGDIDVSVVLEVDREQRAGVCLGIGEGTASPTLLSYKELPLGTGQTEVRCRMRHLPLPRGRFYLWVGVFDRDRDLLPWQPAAYFDVSGAPLGWAPAGIVRQAPVQVEATWSHERR